MLSLQKSLWDTSNAGLFPFALKPGFPVPFTYPSGSCPIFGQPLRRSRSFIGTTDFARRKGVYVQSVTLDGAPYANSWLPIAKLHGGTVQLHFTISEQADKKRETRKGDRPPSFR